MDLRSLHVFRLVAETGSITAAAGRLGIVQSAASARIGQLEDALGETLFERLPRGIRLTPAGCRLLPYVERIERLAEEALATARGRHGAFVGSFRLGVIEIAAATVMPALLGRFAAVHPDVTLNLSSGVTQDLVGRVAASELDAAIVVAGATDSALASYPVGRLPLAFFRPKMRLSQRSGQAFAFGAGCVCRERLEAVIRRRRLGFPIVSLTSMDAIFGCVEAGMGVTLLPETLGHGRDVEGEPLGRVDLCVVGRPAVDGMIGQWASAVDA